MMRSFTSSLRRRLLLSTFAATAVIFVAAALVLYVTVSRTLISEFDAALTAKAQALAGMAETGDAGMKLEGEAAAMPEFHRTRRPEYFQLWASDGKTVVKAASLGDRQLTHPGADLTDLRHEPLILPDGRRGRQVAMRFSPRWEDEAMDVRGKAPPAILVLARDTRELDRTLSHLRWLLLAVCAAATIAAAAAMSLVVVHGLRPVNALAARIGAIAHADLSQRIEPTGIPHELLPIVDRLNDLLSRLDNVLAREKAFTADVAHELRTPLAGLTTTLEVCATQPREPAAYMRTIDQCLRITRGMYTMVNNLLLLARADTGQIKTTIQSVELLNLMSDCWNHFAPSAQSRGLRVQWQVDPGLVVCTDADKLRHILGNLFDNAVSYADVNGCVTISARAGADATELTIANSGSQLSADDAPHAFDRFWRGDAARSDTGLHCGLGLSLCEKIVHVLGGSIAVQSQLDGQFIATVRLPNRTATADSR